MQKRGEEVGIIVVIYAQLPELTPWVNADFMGTGQAELFLKSFVEDFKPQFEKKYLAQATATIMGADVAGLFAIYAATQYPELFGACGAFSPAIWYNKAELTNYLNAYQPINTQTRFALAYTAQDMQTIKDDIQSIAALLAQKGFTQIQTCEGNGMHDDRSWGKLFPQVFSYLQGQTSKLSTIHPTPYTLHPTPYTQHLTLSTPTWTFMNGTSSSSLTCEGTTTQAGFYYKDGKTPQAAQMLVKEIPVDSKTYSYYWNMNNGADCNGTTLMASPKDIGFKSSRKTLSWQRVAIFEDGTYEQSAASSAHFKVNGQTMTIADNYTLTATISLIDDKTISVHYGSVNSGSDMGELVSAIV
ncbi:MAG: alpha/beta hydrolase-fold protein, partial [Paludibacteraceae bacterium]|nr:alpha/beta hydrolase-fold protein [Paludibacteraceae bacterium]